MSPIPKLDKYMEDQLKEIKRLLSDEAKATRQLQEDMEKIKKYMSVRVAINILWMIIAFLPTLLALLYLPAFVHESLGNFLRPLL